jgi:chromosome segregation ATPase
MHSTCQSLKLPLRMQGSQRSAMWGTVILIAIIQSGLVAFFIFSRVRRANAGLVKQFELIQDEVQQKRDLWSKVEAAQTELATQADMRQVGRDFIESREILKVERGRVTITQAELETLEGRMRELEEIGRELEASQTETKEELKILRRKEEDMRSKNDSLRGQIADSLAKMDGLLTEIELTGQMQNQVAVMKSELLRSEEKIQTMLNQIQQCNEQYFNLKRRYDALDVEYAQLYQQLTERSQRG